MSASENQGFNTRAVHAGGAPDPTTGDRPTPIKLGTLPTIPQMDNAADTDLLVVLLR